MAGTEAFVFFVLLPGLAWVLEVLLIFVAGEFPSVLGLVWTFFAIGNL